jgi:hypothetical protein
MKIQLTTPAEVIAQPQVMKTISSITIHSIMDMSSFEKNIIAHTSEFGSVVLWDGEAYDAIGQWTDSDVQARLFELFNLA